jgi:acetyltransferase
MVRFSQKVVEHPWIEEIGLNPMLASSKGLLAPDARVLLHALSIPPDQPAKPAIIRPYPSQYVSQFTMADGAEVTLRPIRPEDEPLMRKFHETLSERSV